MSVDKSPAVSDEQIKYFFREDGEFVQLVRIIGEHFRIENMMVNPLDRKRNKFLLIKAWSSRPASNLFLILNLKKNRNVSIACARLKSLRRDIMECQNEEEFPLEALNLVDLLLDDLTKI